MKTRKEDVIEETADVPEETTEAPAGPEVRTAEEWAKAKGMSERFLPSTNAFANPNPLFQDYAQARAHGGWPIGKELTEAQFDAAVIAAKTPTFG